MKRVFLLGVIVSALTLSSCDVLQQIGEMATFARCEFRLSTVEGITLGGVNVQKVSNLNQLNLQDAARLTAALASGQLPLDLTLNVQVKNPNTSAASLNRLEWILFIDDIQMVSGLNQNTVNIPPQNGTATLPLRISVDLKKALSGRSGDALLNFGLNLAGAGNRPTRIMLKAKPSIVVAGNTVPYPGYLSIRNDFVSQ